MRSLKALVFVAPMAIVLSISSVYREQRGATSGCSPMQKESNSNKTRMASQRPGGDQANSDMTEVKIGSRLTKEEVEEVIRLHNLIRADVGVGPLKWSKELATYAQGWADHLAEAGCKMEHRPHSGKWQQKHGENLFTGTAGFYGVGDAVKAWETERSLYKGGVLTNSNWYASGHYTQMVWCNTKLVGCAKVQCNGKIIVVCNYDPPGNVLWQRPY